MLLVTKQNNAAKRVAAIFMAVTMLLALFPTGVFAQQEEEKAVSYERITTQQEFTTGEYLIVTDDGYALDYLDGTWVAAHLQDQQAQNHAWTITVADNTATLTDENGKTIAPKGSDVNGIVAKDYSWNWTWQDGAVTFAGQENDAVTLACNKQYDYKARAYKNSTLQGTPGNYVTAFSLYKKVEESNPGGDVDAAKCASPVATPDAGEVKAGTQITLTCITPDAVIYYTMDGTTPTAEKGTKYSEETKPVIKENCTLQAIAVKGDAVSEVMKRQYTVSVQPDANATPISQVREQILAGNTSEVTVSGTAITNYSASALGVYLQDSTGGIMLFGDEFLKDADIQPGDVITVTGTGSNYNGKLQIKPTQQVEKLGTATVDAKVITLDQVNEQVAGTLVKMEQLKVSQISTDDFNNVVMTLQFASQEKTYTIQAKYDSRRSGGEQDSETLMNTVKETNTADFTGVLEGSGSDLTKYTLQLRSAADVANVQEGTTEPEPEQITVSASPASGATIAVGDTIALTSQENATIYYTMTAKDGSEPQEPTQESTKYENPITVEYLPENGSPLVIKAVACVPQADGTVKIGDVVTLHYYQAVGMDDLNLYFGQLHSHTNISDGSGSVEEAFEHASKVDNLDFLAVTDHSNSFDNDTDSGISLSQDATKISSEFAEGRKAAADITSEDFVGIYGFEMTWSDGFGHMNTFNTPGFESRSNPLFGNKSGSTAGYKEYYNRLLTVPQSISQFNHPGTTFGDFQDFAFYSPQIDDRINLIEVGNGEGAIGSSGYFPSYEYYTRALDKGWHVAPTNNQDNHKGNWGDANTARSVVLASELTQDGIYDALQNRRVYATEDNDLSIRYTLNDAVMGSILPEQQNVEIKAEITDPTDSDNAKVEVIVNGGLVIATKNLPNGSGTVEFDFDKNNYSYYYLRITQADKNIAVTAPVWTGESVNAGISETSADKQLIVKNESVDLTTSIYNNDSNDMQILQMVYTLDGQVIHTADFGNDNQIAAGATKDYTFSYTPTSSGNSTIYVELKAMLGNVEQTFTGSIQLKVTDPSLVTKVLIDGTHYNDYVTGYYADRVGNFEQLAAQENTQVTVKQPGDTITADDLKDVSLLVISAPLKYAGKNTSDGAVASTFDDSFVQMVADYAKNGGTVILTGIADYQDNNDGAPYCSTEQINPILEAMGATMRLNDDEVLEDDTNYNGGATQTYRVYMDDFNEEQFPELFEGMQEGQRYSAYSGCSVNVGENGVALVKGSANAYSINSKKRPDDAKGKWDSGKPVGNTASGTYDENTAVVKKGDVVTLATEQVGEGRVYLAGTVFFSNFEIADSGNVDYGDASYANKVILKNILDEVQKPLEISTIQTVRDAYTGEESVGQIFTVQGTVTAGNVEPNAFFDTIYIQDETGGLDIYPVSSTDGTFLPGQRVQITGSLDAYQGDIELRAINVTLLDAQANPIEPQEMTVQQASDYAANGGRLIKVSGKVTKVTGTNGVLDAVMIADEQGNEYRVFFNNYIGYSDENSPELSSFVNVGETISAIGVVYMDPEGVCLRVRDRSEIALVSDGQNQQPTATPVPELPPVTEVPATPAPQVTEKPQESSNQSTGQDTTGAAATAAPTAVATPTPTAKAKPKATATPTIREPEVVEPTATPTPEPTSTPVSEPSASSQAPASSAVTAQADTQQGSIVPVVAVIVIVVAAAAVAGVVIYKKRMNE